MTLCIQSEVEPLQKVLLHRPGLEMETLTPNVLDELLFEDIPWLQRLQEEHDGFSETLRRANCEVYYYADLLADILVDKELACQMVNTIVSSKRIPLNSLREEIIEQLTSLSPRELANVFIAGLRKDTIHHEDNEKRLSWWIQEDFPFYIDPLPNLYFTRDAGMMIGDGLAIANMKMHIREREPWLLDMIRQYHPLFAGLREEPWYTTQTGDSLEGGDVLILSETAIAIGASVRTGSDAIEALAHRLFAGESGIREILAIRIPPTRAYIHLDTVITMIDKDTFTLFSGVKDAIRVFHLTPSPTQGIRIREIPSLDRALATALHLPSVRIIQSGGLDWHTAAREQWNDSANTLAIAPGTIVTYNRNTTSNAILEDAGIRVLPIEGSELVRGRGGPRCMSMPLLRGR